MLAKIIIALLSALTGSIITTHIKDTHILRLQQTAVKEAMSSFNAGWEAGVEEGRFQEKRDALRRNACHN